MSIPICITVHLLWWEVQARRKGDGATAALVPSKFMRLSVVLVNLLEPVRRLDVTQRGVLHITEASHAPWPEAAMRLSLTRKRAPSSPRSMLQVESLLCHYLWWKQLGFKKLTDPRRRNCLLNGIERLCKHSLVIDTIAFLQVSGNWPTRMSSLPLMRLKLPEYFSCEANRAPDEEWQVSMVSCPHRGSNLTQWGKRSHWKQVCLHIIYTAWGEHSIITFACLSLKPQVWVKKILSSLATTQNDCLLNTSQSPPFLPNHSCPHFLSSGWPRPLLTGFSYCILLPSNPLSTPAEKVSLNPFPKTFQWLPFSVGLSSAFSLTAFNPPLHLLTAAYPSSLLPSEERLWSPDQVTPPLLSITTCLDLAFINTSQGHPALVRLTCSPLLYQSMPSISLHQ